MKEISCTVLGIFFSELKANNISAEILCEGIPYNVDYLRDEKGNIE